MSHKDRRRLRVSVRAEDLPVALELAPQGLKILDDAIVHDRNAVRGDRMSISLDRQAMRRPTSMPDTNHSLYWLVIEPPSEVDELAFRPPAFDASVDPRRGTHRRTDGTIRAP